MNLPHPTPPSLASGSAFIRPRPPRYPFSMIVIGGSASTSLAEKVAKQLGQEPGRIEIKRFPDGEKYIRIHEEVKGQDVALIQSLYRTPDEEAEQWAGTVAKELDAEHTAFTKRRVRKEGETKSRLEMDTGSVDVKGRDIVFADDIISTGGTIAEAAKACKKKGARRIFVLCTHPVLADGALKRIRAAGATRIVGTDTIPSPISTVSVAPVISPAP